MDGSDDDIGPNASLPARRRRDIATAPIVRRPKASPPDLPNLPQAMGDVDHAYHDFLPVALQVIETPPSRVHRALAYGLCGLVTVALLSMIFGYLRIFAVAPGQFQASDGSQVVEPREAGQVRAINVVNGRHVKKGDVVIALDPTAALADKTIIEAKLGEARAEVIRRGVAVNIARAIDKTATIDKDAPIAWPAGISSEVRGRQDSILHADLSQLAATIADLRASLKAKETARDKYVANIAAQKVLIASRTERTAMHEKLAAQGWDSRAMVLQSLEPLRQDQVRLATLQGSLDQANAEIPVIVAEIAKARDGFIADNIVQQANQERQVTDLEQQLIRASLTLEDMSLRAPVDGAVQSLAVTSVGQALKVGEKTMQIVPEGAPLEVRAYVMNNDIGFVRLGQPVTIKVDTFPYTRYGTVSGTVVRIGADAITGALALSQQKDSAATPASGKLSATNAAPETSDLVFPVTIKPDRSTIDVNGRAVPLTAGMSVVAEIETERQRIIEFILYPLSRAWRNPR